MEVGKVGGYGSPPVMPKREKGQPTASHTLARSFVDTFEQGRRMAQERRSTQKTYDPYQLAEQAETARAQAEAKAKELKVLLNCQKIAMRIIAGDKVDPKDLQYLMEHDIKGFQMAMAMRRPKEKPEECERITEDEQEQKQGGETAAPEPAAGAELPAPVPVEGEVPSDL